MDKKKTKRTELNPFQWGHRGSNAGPLDYTLQSTALPAELCPLENLQILSL